ncbi:hypothetical protein QRN89_35285 [Streptomyces chengbuensis]|uniref:hypothetical protein n=1 Tax=Streptomyces TaxID=1883 RepID=UPI0025B50C28|nr:hypothetical protein [Streptomyces sp. HUAS CB01]WJY54596.1 hypothetical protein QRN89_35285 [Streptomyces sp. HUAS CB01]
MPAAGRASWTPPAGLGAALLAVPGGQHPEGLTPVEGLPTVSPVRLSARPRYGADTPVTGTAVEAVPALLAACETGAACRTGGPGTLSRGETSRCGMTGPLDAAWTRPDTPLQES